MSHRDREVEPFFSQPIRQGVMIVVALALFGLGAWIAYPRVAPVFLSNPVLNGIILAVFFIGLIACFWQLAGLVRAVGWIMAFTRGDAEGREPGTLLAPLAVLLRNRGAVGTISASSARSILDSVSTRIEEARDITRYLGNLLIFLGLLGTFFGLATTVPAVVDTIRSLAPSEGEGSAAIFGRLMSGLEDQLGGMGTAFASSLLGLAGSLIIGLVELFVSHGQNRFYRELEDWLSSITRLGFAGGDGEASAEAAILEAFAEHMAGQMESLQSLLLRSESGRGPADGRLEELAESLRGLSAALAERPAPPPDPALERIAAGQERLAALLAEGQERAARPDPALARLAGGQERLAALLAEGQAQAARPDPALTRLAEGQERLIAALEETARRQDEAEAREVEARADLGPHTDAEARMRLRSIDVQLLRILEELAAGRQESLAEIRADLATLIKAVRHSHLRDTGDFAVPQAKRG